MLESGGSSPKRLSEKRSATYKYSSGLEASLPLQKAKIGDVTRQRTLIRNCIFTVFNHLSTKLGVLAA